MFNPTYIKTHGFITKSILEFYGISTPLLSDGGVCINFPAIRKSSYFPEETFWEFDKDLSNFLHKYLPV